VKAWFKKHLLKPERLRGEQVHRILGDRIFANDIWHVNRRSISAGLALGLFIAFTPTIPFQMLLAALLAIWLRINLPIAVIACWVTNPFTAVWIYLMEYRLGKAVLGNLPGLYAISELEDIGAIRKLFSQATFVWTGGMILGATAALIGYVLIQVLWRLPRARRRPD